MNVRSTDMRRWSEEVARDPGSPAFVPLADAYRRQGRREAALRVCLRGLERNPDHVEAHGLLARLHLEAGDRSSAADEWGVVLRLAPDSFEANRGLGFYRLERGELDEARRHLERAARARPDDPTVRDALAVVEKRSRAGKATRGDAAADRGTAAIREAAAAEAPPPEEAAKRRRRDPTRVFDELRGQTPFRGAVLVDRNGLTLAGALGEGVPSAETIGALLGDAIEEAARAADVLDLGGWQGLSLEADRARVHVGALDGGHAVIMAAEADAPAGWVVRTANRARAIAAKFLEAAP